MLDIKFVRENPDIVKQNIKNKFQDEKLVLVDEVLKLDQENRDIKQEVEALRANRNKISKQIGALMAQGKKEEAEAVKKQVTESAARMAELDEREKVVEEEIRKRIKMNLVATLISAGIPFFHQGEEIGASKKGLPNTYNAGDELNGFDYDLLDENKDLYLFFRDAISIKKKYLSFDSTTFYKMLKENRITFDDLDCGALKINYEFDDYTLYVVFNPSKERFMFEFPNYVSLIFNETGILSDSNEDIYIHMAIINGLSINIFYEEKKALKTGGKKK